MTCATSTESPLSVTVSPKADKAALRTALSEWSNAFRRVGVASMRLCPTISMSNGTIFPLALGRSAMIFASTSSPGRSASVSLAVCVRTLSVSSAISSKAERQEASPTRPSATMAAARTCLGPCPAAFNTADRTTVSARSAMAWIIKAARSGVARAISATRAWSTSPPGNSRAVPNANWNIFLSGDRKSSSKSGMPCWPRARIAPRVASIILCWGRSAARTSS